MANTRIYMVTTPNGKHLVEAPNPSQAISHVTKKGVTCESASAKDVAAAMTAGGKVEVAGEEPPVVETNEKQSELAV